MNTIDTLKIDEMVKTDQCGCGTLGNLYPLYRISDGCHKKQQPCVWACLSCWKALWRSGQYRTQAEHFTLLDFLNGKEEQCQQK